MPFLKTIFLFCIILNSQLVFCQDTIFLKNPSFEGMARKGVPGGPGIKGWKDCGTILFANTSPPDLLPDYSYVLPAWGVTTIPNDGDTYLSMVVRAEHSWEYISQELSAPLQAGKCYSMSAMLAMSDSYSSPTKASQLAAYKNPSQIMKEGFSNPVMLVIWGGRDDCERFEILAESGDVSNADWKAFEWTLTPHENYTFITIEAYYSKLSGEHYNGHILVDNLSEIIEKECR